MITKPCDNCYWVIPGKFLAGEYPGSPDEEEARRKIGSLLRAGVDCFIDLTEATDGLKPYAYLLPHPARHLEFPLPDFHVPSSKKKAAAILDAIDEAIQGGHTIYIHCWGGIGRTGLIVGCWLARHGRKGQAALDRLRALWQQCRKSRRRGTPETAEQEQFILNWSEEASSAEQSRYLGSLLGLAAGDALGTTVEFRRPGTSGVLERQMSDIVGGGPFHLEKGQWTDDTSMALCLAESLLSCRGFDPRDQIERYLRWKERGYLSSTGECFDIGNTVSDALSRYKRTGNPFAGSTAPDSAGNGSIMRLAPVPLFYASDPREAIARSGESSKTTHGCAACIDACRYLGALIVGAVGGAPKEELLSPRYSPVPHVWDGEPLCSEVDEIASGSFKRKSPPEILGSGYVIKSLEAALWAFYHSKNFRDGCLLAVNLGNDADTTGAVYGQLAGAYYGYDGIPVGWRECLAHSELIHTFALGLQKHGAGA